jgi:hypothetical protein
VEEVGHAEPVEDEADLRTRRVIASPTRAPMQPGERGGGAGARRDPFRSIAS